VLGVASAIVHGLRLNLIEYLNWSIADEGRQFKAFSRKVATND
jgi:V/A-type H+-transporting ATPase subunit I